MGPLQFPSPWLSLILMLGVTLIVLLPLWLKRRGVPMAGPALAISAVRLRWVLWIRFLSLTALVLALSGARLLSAVDGQCLIFLVDRSLSCSDQDDAVRDYVNSVLAVLGPKQEATFLSFGSEAAVEMPPGRPVTMPRLSASIDRNATDLAAALRMAYASLPSDKSCRIVLLSDGRATRGQALLEAETSAQLGVEVDTVLLDKVSKSEVLLESLESPPSISPNTPFELRLVAYSNQEGLEATVVVEAQGSGLQEKSTEVSRQKVLLHKGSNLFLIPQRSPAATVLRYSAHLESTQDSENGNNRAQTSTVVRGPAKVLLLSEGGPGAAALAQFLAGSGLLVEQVGPGDLPTDLAEWQGYQSIIVDDVSAERLTPVQLDWMAALITEMGMGMVVVGGPNSYGAGGYHQTSLAQTWPIELDIRKRKNFPASATIHIIDKSGSMSEQQDGVEKIQLAREAAIASLEMMSPEDKVGVIGFDDAFKWMVPLQKVVDRATITQAIASLRAGGGTSLYGGLRAAIVRLTADDSPVRHILVLTDGQCEPADFKALAKQAEQEKITISTVAVGAGADRKFLEQLANWGKGKSYIADSANVLPRIFNRDIVLASRKAFVEGDIEVAQSNQHPVLKGTKLSAKGIRGYNLVAPKEGANLVLLTSSKQDPVLAAGRSGLGKVVTLMCDDGTRWAQGWDGSGQLAQLLVQAVRWSLPESNQSRLQWSIQPQDQQNQGRKRLSLHLGELSAQSRAEAQSAQVSVIDPLGQVTRIPLEQTSLSDFTAVLPDGGAGSWLVQVNSANGNERGRWTQSYSVPYSPELAHVGPDRGAMEALAKAGNGRFNPTPAQCVAPPSRVRTAARELWPDLLTLALLLLPLEIALRRVQLPDWKLLRRGQSSDASPENPEASNRLLARKKAVAPKKAAQPLAPAASATTPVVSASAPTPTKTTATTTVEGAVGSSLDRLKKAKKRGS